MNFKTTLVLLLLVASGAGFWLVRSPLASRLGLGLSAPEADTDDTLVVLEDRLTPDKLTRIEIKPRHADAVVLERVAGGDWTALGGWPTRKPEIDQLVKMLTGLRSRFALIATDEEHPLKDYGLDSPAVYVTLTADAKEYKLA